MRKGQGVSRRADRETGEGWGRSGPSSKRHRVSTHVPGQVQCALCLKAFVKGVKRAEYLLAPCANLKWKDTDIHVQESSCHVNRFKDLELSPRRRHHSFEINVCSSQILYCPVTST